MIAANKAFGHGVGVDKSLSVEQMATLGALLGRALKPLRFQKIRVCSKSFEAIKISKAPCAPLAMYT